MKRDYIRIFSRIRQFLWIIIISFAVSCSSDVMDGLVTETGLQPQAGGDSLTVVSAEALSNTTIKITFSQDVDLVTSENPSNYSITSGLSVLGALRDGAVFSEVVLTTDSQNNVSYTVTASGITDMLGNPLETPNTGTFTGDALPYLVSATANTNTSVMLQFSEPVELPAAELLASYSIDNGLTITNAARNLSDYSIVELTTIAQNNVSYTLMVNGITDISGNAIGTPDSDSFTGYTFPFLVSASATNNTTVELHFSEAVDQASSETEGNYSIPGLTVSLAVRDAVDFTIVRLTTSTQSGAGYMVSVSGITSALGVPLGTPDSAAFTGDARPNLVSASATGTMSVDLQFSEPVELASAENEANYSIPGLTVTLASRDAGDNSIVHLTTGTHSDTSYTVTVGNVKDATGNTIGSPNSDVFAGDTAPHITNVSAYNNTTVVIYYSEPVNLAGAENEVNYSIDNGLGVPLNAVRDPVDFSKVTLTTNPQTGGTSYMVTVNSVTDLTGNTLTSPNSEFFTGIGVSDTIKPRVISAIRVGDDMVEVVFSKPIDQATSEATANYTIRNNAGAGVTLLSVARQADLTRVRIVISGTFTSPFYIVTAGLAILDTAAPANSMDDAPYNSASFSGTGTIPQTFEDGPVIVDPMNEGSTSFSMLTVYKGRVYIGPADTENAVFRLRPDGSSPEIVTFMFHGESATRASLSPGPDDENGIDYITGGTINGVEYLFIGPSKINDLNYIYYTSDTGSVIDFDYMDLHFVLGGQVMGITSMLVFNNYFFIGLSDDGGAKPYFAKIVNIINNPVTDTDLFDIDTKIMPRIGKSASTHANSIATTLGIDSMVSYENRLYIANGGGGTDSGDAGKNGGIMRSVNNNPQVYSGPATWTDDVTPDGLNEWYNAPSYNRFSIPLPDVANKILPYQKAFPAMVVFNGSLYAIRNTTGAAGGPQLWKFDGSNWSLIADNGSGLTNMESAGNASLTLLIVNGDRLYIGYDNSANGINIWRTKSGVTDPSLQSDFEAVSTDGFGDAANNQRIYHYVTVPDGGYDFLWLLSGKAGGALRVYRAMN